MDTLTGKPKLLKQANLSLIRKIIRENFTATRAEIAAYTQISSTTVRSLLNEMLENGEIESIGYDESSGGRKAERYRFKPNRYHSAAFCITDNQIHFLLINVCGHIVETMQLETPDIYSAEAIIFSFLDDLIKNKEIKSIGIGVPGVIEKESYIRQNRLSGEFERSNIGEKLYERYKIPVILENDVNSTAIGFLEANNNTLASHSTNEINLAYLHFEKSCINSGFISNGKIIRGCNNFAGEIGLLTMEDGKLLDENFSEALGDSQYINNVVNVLTWISGILNPKQIVLSGQGFREHCFCTIKAELFKRIPTHMQATVLFSSDVWQDYYYGMARLTVGKMFNDIQLIRG